MQFFIIVLLISFFVFLFTLYYLSQDDFIFIRKNIQMETIFNAAFIVGILSLICARTLYVFSFPKPVFHTFLGFILFPYFPGLSLVGAIFGGAIFLIIYSLWKKFPIGRISDFFSLSFLSALPVGFAGAFLLGLKNIYTLSSIIFYFIFLVIALKILLKLLTKGKLRDGSIGLLILIVFSLFIIIVNVLKNHFSFGITFENLILFVGLIIALSLFIFREIVGKGTA